MPTPVKSHGFKLGKLEKNVIHLMRKGDEPQGKPILIWNDICQTYGIEFSAYPKKDQPEELYKENKYKCALTRLVKIHILKPSIIIQQTSKSNSLIPHPKGHGYNYYSLTDFGRLEPVFSKGYKKSLMLLVVFYGDDEAWGIQQI